MVINVNECTHLVLGRQGESGATSFEFDISEWVAQYGEGTLTLTAKRSQDTEPYPVPIDGNVWTVSDADTAFEGYGEAQLTYTVGDVVVKTVIYGTITAPSIIATTPDPYEPYTTWLDSMQTAAQNAEDAAEAAQGYAEDAAESARHAAEVFTFTAEDGDVTIARSV